MQEKLHVHGRAAFFFSVRSSKRFSGKWSGLLLSLLLLTGFSPSAYATDFYKSFVIIKKTVDNSQLEKYYHALSDKTDPFDPINGANLGSFDRSSGQLQLSGAEANTYTQPTTDGVAATRLYYVVYPTGARPSNPAFTALNLPLNSTLGNNQKWVASNTNINLIALAGFVGEYKLELYYELDGTYPPSGTFTLADHNNGTNNPGPNYVATFTVTNDPPVVTGTTWNGNVNSDWFNASNWSSGVPNLNTDAVIPVLPANRAIYPEIINYSATGQPAATRSLIISGTGPTNRGRLTLNGGELRVHGNFDNPANGFSSSGGDFVLAGTNQTIDAASFFNLRVEGGGNKIVSSRIEVQTFLNLVSGTLETRTGQPALYSVDLRSNARIGGESSQSYVIGVLRNDRVLAQGARDDFGNIGIAVQANGAAPGKVFTIRTTSLFFPDIGGKPSIKRAFDFTTIENNSNLNATINFTYLPTEVLSGTNESGLKLFQIVPNGSTFVDRGRDGNIATITSGAKVLTKAGINELSLFTLGDGIIAPLPVSLTSFTAVRQGANALLTWTTAQEENNYGFDVQVSTNGQDFRTLGTILSQSPTTTQAQSYRYRDTEASKYGTRYYRLRQLDKNGRESFYGPRTVVFDEAATFSAAPNPFSEALTLTAQSTVAGAATLRFTDLNGRVVREQRLKMDKGVSALPVADLNGLSGGMYFIQLVLPDGQVQRAKLLKT